MKLLSDKVFKNRIDFNIHNHMPYCVGIRIVRAHRILLPREIDILNLLLDNIFPNKLYS